MISVYFVGDYNGAALLAGVPRVGDDILLGSSRLRVESVLWRQADGTVELTVRWAG